MLKRLKMYKITHGLYSVTIFYLRVCVCVCLQGDNADCMFFVEDGEIRIAMRQSVGTSQQLVHSHTRRRDVSTTDLY